MLSTLEDAGNLVDPEVLEVMSTAAAAAAAAPLQPSSGEQVRL